MDVISQFHEKFHESLHDGTFVRLLISRPLHLNGGPEKIQCRLVEIKERPYLSLTFQHASKDITKNLPVEEAGAWLVRQLGPEFRAAFLFTTKRDWQFFLLESGEARLFPHKPAETEAPSRSHDQPKTTALGADAQDWLRGLGILGDDGKVRASMADKYRQINHYLEILGHLAKECRWEGRRLMNERSGPSAEELVVADMGCGKGYLTFGAWHLFRRVWELPVRVTGVDARPELVAGCAQLAGELNAQGLSFKPGTIGSVAMPKLDALIALHACDTATDDAIRRGIELGAQLIVLSPCCQKELRPQLKSPPVLAPVMDHGIMSERLAEWLTDGLRAMFLEWAGYRTKVFEFVSLEHTSRNVMIAAIREREPFTSAEIRDQIVELKRFFGVEHHALDSLLQSRPAT